MVAVANHNAHEGTADDTPSWLSRPSSVAIHHPGTETIRRDAPTRPCAIRTGRGGTRHHALSRLVTRMKVVDTGWACSYGLSTTTPGGVHDGRQTMEEGSYIAVSPGLARSDTRSHGHSPAYPVSLTGDTPRRVKPDRFALAWVGRSLATRTVHEHDGAIPDDRVMRTASTGNAVVVIDAGLCVVPIDGYGS